MKRNDNSATIYPATAQDRMNYLIGILSSDQQIAIQLSFSIQLDAQVLERAFQLTLKLIPILNCRFVEADVPYWESVAESLQGTVCSLEECTETEIESKVNEYIAEPGDYKNGPMLQAKLFRARKDRLCVKISHLCSDAAGLKEYIELFASIYTRLCRSTDSDLIESELLANQQPGFRDQSIVFSEAGITDIKSVLRQNEGASYLWLFPSNPAANVNPKIAIRRLDSKHMERLIRRCKEYEATLNDALCTAYIRSLADQAVFMEPCNKEGVAITITIDLRRYLHDRTTGTVCNLSASEVLIVKLQDGEDFVSTMVKVKKAMDKIKSNQPGLSSAAGMEMMAEVPLSTAREAIYSHKNNLTAGMNMVLPYLTNLGVIAANPLRFGASEAEDGYMTAPVTHAPFFCMGASTYNGVLTLSIGFRTPAVSEEEVNRLLDIMMKELTF